ncbi:ABC transporter permease [Pseudooceanicola sp. CBS1P-1]|uniref:ABC transporter permease subunit n=1 Tax=Pseudooceanicola albus TaxID=2692189 RepID=A0A6L7G7S3_9RHOB|nr:MULTISPECIES: ABC transporter permease [Pseudooceanicola]MBT9385932.1 ABC transporter permease [Pseudooceanicola endophyticus]MXN19647.1 ABC transporter permease subunit [Pseudooceanicola albus]
MPDQSLTELETALNRADVRRRWWLSLPALLIVLLAGVGPLAIVVIYSFLAPGDYGDVVWKFSPEGWFNVLFTKDIFDGTISIADAHLSIFWRSFKLSAITTILCLIVGFPTAYYMAGRSPRTRALLLLLITVPFWTNLLIRAFAIQQLLRSEGVVNLLLMKLGLIDQPVQLLYTDFAILVGMTYVYLPLMVLPLYSTMEKFDFRLTEAAYDLYASRFQVLTRVVIPLVRPGLIAGATLVFIPCLGTYVIPRILGGGSTLMIGNLIELQFGQGRNWPLGAALSITLVVLVMLGLLIFQRNDRSGGEK